MARSVTPVVVNHDQRTISKKNPVWFATKRLGVKPWNKQAEILETLATNKHVAVRSCNGSGKTFTAALATLWWLSAYDEAIVITTAPTDRQVRNLLWREIRKLYDANRALFGRKITQTKLELSENRYAFGFATDKTERFQGFHNPNILIIVDEASGVREFVFDAISGCMTTANAKLLMIGNPTSLAGTFYDAFHKNRDLYKTIHISAFDTPAFTGEVPPGGPLPSGVPTREWVSRIARERGQDSAEYYYRVLGDYPLEAVDTLISLKLIEAAVKKEVHDDGNQPAIMGLDVARFGDAQTVAVIRRGSKVIKMEAFRKTNLMDTTGRTLDLARRYNVDTLYVDEVGVGAGVLDRIRETDDIHAVGVNGGRQPTDKDLYYNLKAEKFDGLKQRFEDGSIAIPDDAELISQLASMTYEYTSKGLLKLETKQQIRNAGRQSPDKADALALAFTATLPKKVRNRPRVWLLDSEWIERDRRKYGWE